MKVHSVENTTASSNTKIQDNFSLIWQRNMPRIIAPKPETNHLQHHYFTTLVRIAKTMNSANISNSHHSVLRSILRRSMSQKGFR